MSDLPESAREGLLHVWECAWVLKLSNGKRCGHISQRPGKCPYDHGEDVPLVEIKALVLCSDCEEPIMRHDSRASDDARLICGQCVMSELADA
jgi:hypothetical protein